MRTPRGRGRRKTCAWYKAGRQKGLEDGSGRAVSEGAPTEKERQRAWRRPVSYFHARVVETVYCTDGGPAKHRMVSDADGRPLKTRDRSLASPGENKTARERNACRSVATSVVATRSDSVRVNTASVSSARPQCTCMCDRAATIRENASAKSEVPRTCRFTLYERILYIISQQEV